MKMRLSPLSQPREAKAPTANGAEVRHNARRRDVAEGINSLGPLIQQVRLRDQIESAKADLKLSPGEDFSPTPLVRNTTQRLTVGHAAPHRPPTFVMIAAGRITRKSEMYP